MAQRIYRVISIIGRKRTVVFETAPMDVNTIEERQAFSEALKARDKYKRSLHSAGCSATWDERYYHPDTKEYERVVLDSLVK